MAKPFVAACAQYFGRREGQTLGDFKKEIDELTASDKAQLAAALSEALGEPVHVTPPGA